MRWTKTEIGAIRRRIKFAWFPITIGNDTRWMEWVHFEEQWLYEYPFIKCGAHWHKVQFLEYTPKKT